MAQFLAFPPAGSNWPAMPPSIVTGNESGPIYVCNICIVTTCPPFLAAVMLMVAVLGIVFTTLKLTQLFKDIRRIRMWEQRNQHLV
jgi:hypothetical protein